MDLLWRVIVDFALQGRGMQLRGAVDEASTLFLLQDDACPLDKKRFRTWAKLGAPPSEAQCAQLRTAIERRDVVVMRRMLRTALHYCCTTVRVTSQERDCPRSVHVAWTSQELTGAETCTMVTHGPHAPFECGLTMLVTVRPELAPWLAHTFLYTPLLSQDESLLAQHSRGLGPGQHAINTPIKRAEFDPLEALDSPSLTEKTQDEHVCCLCNRRMCLALVLFAERCGHVMCVRCATACAKKHVASHGATTTNMPCPEMECEESLGPADLRPLLSREDYALLEHSEVRIALADGVTCPNCSAIFDREFEHATAAADDPLRHKFTCGACGVNFCVSCNVMPFHEDRPCRVVHASSGPTCRYCGNPAVNTSLRLCESDDCQKKGRRCCSVTKPCGHLCHGTAGERNCARCLDESCPERNPHHEASDLCSICWVDALNEAPCLELACGHVFHTHCLEEKLVKRWPTARITFSFLECPLCGEPIKHPLLSTQLGLLLRFRDGLEARFAERLRLEGLMAGASERDVADPVGHGYRTLNYYQCFRCHRPYFGGLRECAGADREDPNREELVCGGCSAGSAKCTVHGGQYMEYKCKYCCNLAVWFCWGTTHFCDLCHNPPRKTVRVECPGEELCPLKIKHLPNGQECALGCSMCRACTEPPGGAAAKAEAK